MRNQFPGVCYRCGEQVEAGQGHFERASKAQLAKWPQASLPKWLTQHAACAIKWRDTPQHHRFHDLRQKEPQP